MPRQYRRYFAKFYAYPDSDPTAMLRAPWETSLRCHGALGVPPATLRRVCCDATATCFRGDLIALVLSMFKTWRRPRRPWRPYCDLQRCHGALWDITTTQRQSGQFLLIAARSPSCVTGVLKTTCHSRKQVRNSDDLWNCTQWLYHEVAQCQSDSAIIIPQKEKLEIVVTLCGWLSKRIIQNLYFIYQLTYIYILNEL